MLALPARVADCLDWEGLDAVPMVAPVQARAHALPAIPLMNNMPIRICPAVGAESADGAVVGMTVMKQPAPTAIEASHFANSQSLLHPPACIMSTPASHGVSCNWLYHLRAKAQRNSE